MKRLPIFQLYPQAAAVQVLKGPGGGGEGQIPRLRRICDSLGQRMVRKALRAGRQRQEHILKQ